MQNIFGFNSFEADKYYKNLMNRKIIHDSENSIANYRNPFPGDVNIPFNKDGFIYGTRL